MGTKYRFTGGLTSDSRPDKVEVESPNADNPQGKVLELHDPASGRIGNSEELSEDQVGKLSKYITLEPVSDDEVAEAGDVVDQPGLNVVSSSTDSPPDHGTTPDLESLNRDGLDEEIAGIRKNNPNALGDIKGNSSLEDKRDALNDYYSNKGV